MRGPSPRRARASRHRQRRERTSGPAMTTVMSSMSSRRRSACMLLLVLLAAVPALAQQQRGQANVRTRTSSTSSMSSSSSSSVPAARSPAVQAVSRAAGAYAYSVPAPRVLALAPRGLRLTIPDSAGISSVRFHLAVNRPLSAQRLGSINVEVTQPTGAAWAYEDRTTILGAGDRLHYWLQVVRAGHTYERAGSHTVEDFVETYDVGVSALSEPPVAVAAAAAPPPAVTAPSPLPPSLQQPQQQRPKPNQQQQQQQQQQSCSRSLTSVNGRLVCRGELLFLEHFDAPENLAGLGGLGVGNAGMWVHDVRIAGPPDYEFTAYTASPANSYSVNGQLVLRPTLTDDVYGKDFVRTGRLQLDNCTASDAQQCARHARYGFILPPVLSGRISTRKSFSFRYGVLEIRAKLPSGDWIYPELWLLPREEAYGPGLRSGRVEVAMARGNADLHLGATELGLRRLEAAAVASTSTAAPGQPSAGEGDDDRLAEDTAAAAPALSPYDVRLATNPAATRPAAVLASVPTTTTTTTTTTTSRPIRMTTRTAASTTVTASRASTATTASTQQQAARGTPSPPSVVSSRVASPASGSTTTTTTRAAASSAQTRTTPPTPASTRRATTASVMTVTRSKQGGGSSSSSSGGSRPQTLSSATAATPYAASSHYGYVRQDDDNRENGKGIISPRARRTRRSYATTATGYAGPARKEVSRTELPGRPWSAGFHNYTLRWTPDAMVFSVDGVELGTLLPEESGGFLADSDPNANAGDSPWARTGGRMAPFDREFFISLGLAVGGIHNFPEGVEGLRGSIKPWKNTAAKAMLSFWNAKDEWYRSWTTDSALLVDFVRVTAL